MGGCFPLGWEGGSEERAGARLSVASTPRELGWLEKNCNITTLGRCVCACKLARVCMCAPAPGKGSWVNWCVAGTEARGPSPQSMAGRKPVAGKELKLVTRSGQVGRKKSPCSQGGLAQLSQQSALSMELGVGVRLPGPIADIPGVWGFLGSLLNQPHPSAEAPSARLLALAASSPGLAVTPYTSVSCRRRREELTLCKF